MENPFVEAVENDGESDESNHGANNSKEADDAEIFEEQGFAEAVSCREDDGRQNDGEKKLSWELKILVKCLGD